MLRRTLVNDGLSLLGRTSGALAGNRDTAMNLEPPLQQYVVNGVSMTAVSEARGADLLP